MLMLCGGATLLLAFSTWYTQGSPNPLLLKQLTHAEFGAGFTAWDLVMPLFIFIFRLCPHLRAPHRCLDI